ncbi:MAG: DsrE family protein [Candidatus Manganitrophus sp. SB1]|nr:DsrE family protein [Candidatus Manganitrophus morganii]
MTRSVVILIRSDPETSHRAVEGIRIALGLASGDHAVEVILTGRAPLLLTPDTDTFVDGEMAEKFLSTLQEFIPTFYIDQESAKEVALSESDYKTVSLSKKEIAEKIAAAQRFALF